MADNPTPQQTIAIENRGGRLLVSAAAGSGKTKVLVDRLMMYLTDKYDPANIDEFLLITFTTTAAAELRSKIAEKLSDRIAEDPGNRHLQRQLQRLYMTQISTVHSFCGELLRQYAYRLDLSPDFRVADDNESKQISASVIDNVMDRAYTEAWSDPDFCVFVDSNEVQRNEDTLSKVILSTYEMARCHVNPDKWLDECVAMTDVSGLTDAGQTVWGRYLMDQLFRDLDDHIAIFNHCAKLADEANAKDPAKLLLDTVSQLQFLRSSETWDQVVDRKNIQFGTMSLKKYKVDPDLETLIKTNRDMCKKAISAATIYFTDKSERILADLAASAASVRSLVKLVRMYDKAYSAEKKRRGLMDFTDLEQRTMDLLFAKDRCTPTALAREIGNRYREVMVDEYQDSNKVQDAIYMALTNSKQNCFMVGDVKQSIYSFRLAEPGIFLDKYDRYMKTDLAKDGDGRKVSLSQNFRSGEEILSAVNCVFELCMTKEFGGLEYNEDEKLHLGKKVEKVNETAVEFYGIRVQHNTYAEEADFVAKRIEELLDGSHMIRGKEGLRPIEPGDIKILLRITDKVASYFVRALRKRGIPCISEKSENPLLSPEVVALHSILQVINNPQQDIPLVSAMASPLFGFTADELAQIRSCDKDCSFYDAVKKSDHPKAKSFAETIQKLRRIAKIEPVSKILETVFLITEAENVYAAMPDGQRRQDNIRGFYQLACSYESRGQRDLGRFLDFISKPEKLKMGTDDGSKSNAVYVTSVHLSKGLEYPVVFLPTLSKSFVDTNSKRNVLCHKKLGIGVSVADPSRRVYYPSISRVAVGEKLDEDALFEELRILYVAMTRARDRLIMSYADSHLEKTISEMVAMDNIGCENFLKRKVSCIGDWVLWAALRRTDAGVLFALGGKNNKSKVYDHPWKISVVDGAVEESVKSGSFVDCIEDMTMTKEMKQRLEFRYDHSLATAVPSKITATNRKIIDTKPEVKRYWKKPGAACVSGADFGTAMHAVMQHIRFECCRDLQGICDELDRIASKGLITTEMRNLIQPQQILDFFATEIGQKMLTGSQILREFRFSVLTDADKFVDGVKDEKILVQGVVDCAVIDDDGITIIDFKTDRVSAGNLSDKADYYRPQLMIYADALSRIFKKDVQGAYLHFFHLNQSVSVM